MNPVPPPPPAHSIDPASGSGARLYVWPVRYLFAFVLALLMLVQGALSLYAWSISEQQLLPELGRKAQTAGTALSVQLLRAVDNGIPLQRLEGVQEYFGDVLKTNTDLAYLRVNDRAGALLFASTAADSEDPARFLDTALPLVRNGKTLGILHVGVDRRHIASRIQELRYDIGIVLLTSLLIAFEILWFVVTLNFTAPMRQLVTRLTHVAAGDFRRHPAPPPGAGAGMDAARRLHGWSCELNQAHDALHSRATALAVAEGGKPPQARQTQYSRLLQQLRTTYTFGVADEDALVQHRVVLVRVLSFLFMFAEMLSRPFLPVYAASLPAHGVSTSLHASLPITAFLLGVAVSMPFAGGWSDRLGRRSSYISGALTVGAGLAATALVPDYLALVVARAVTGAGYAMMFMACQGYVFDHTDRSNRGQGMALFVGAIMVAEICAPAVGGILADRIGYRDVFLLGACVALAAAALAAGVLHKPQDRGQGLAGGTTAGADVPVASMAPASPLVQPISSGPADSPWLLARLAHNGRFLALSLLSGVPAKFLYSGFLIFLVPVLLASLGHSKAEVGRYTMLYGISSLALAPVFAHIADRYRAYVTMVVAGGVLTGLGMLPIAYGASASMVMLGIAALGVGQAMSISAQLVLVVRVTQQEAQQSGPGRIVGLFRLLERLGAAAGPIATGMLVAYYGPAHTMTLLGGFALASSLLFALIYLLTGGVRAGAGDTAAAGGVAS